MNNILAKLLLATALLAPPAAAQATLRSAPPDGFWGGKIAKLDRVEWITMPELRKSRDITVKAMDALQERFYQVMPYVIAGQFLAPKAWHNTITGMTSASVFVFWNVEKK